MSMQGNEVQAPGVSIIVPVYNSEPFIKETLMSVVNQTFKDYELIVIDDCSTDRSVEIVEGMAELFEGRLRLIKSEKNSGGYAGVVRNIGLRAATGKYIAFLDSDDLFTPTALEELFSLAEKYQTDILRCDVSYRYRKGVEFAKLPKAKIAAVTRKPTVESNDIAARLQTFIGTKHGGHPPWKHFILRSLLIENQIEFPRMRIMEDNSFVFFCLVCAQKFLRVPNVVYVYRIRSASVSHNRLELHEDFNRYLNDFRAVFEQVAEFMGRHEFFAQNPEWRMRMFRYITRRRLLEFSGISKIPALDLYKCCDELSGLFAERLSTMRLESVSQLASFYTCLSTNQDNEILRLKTELTRFKVQAKLNPIKPPTGALTSYFGTLLTVDGAGTKLTHSGNAANAVTLIVDEKKFSLYISLLGKYIASMTEKFVLTLADAPSTLGDIVKNADGSISLKVAGKFLSTRTDGSIKLVPKNKAWECFTFNG